MQPSTCLNVIYGMDGLVSFCLSVKAASPFSSLHLWEFSGMSWGIVNRDSFPLLCSSSPWRLLQPRVWKLTHEDSWIAKSSQLSSVGETEDTRLTSSHCSHPICGPTRGENAMLTFKWSLWLSSVSLTVLGRFIFFSPFGHWGKLGLTLDVYLIFKEIT